MPGVFDEAWILAQDPAHYTIQAIGLRSRAKLEGLIEGLEDHAPWAIYTVQRDTNPLHVLVQGVYATVEEARAARDAFPRQVNRPDRVWIRTFGKVQEVIAAELEKAAETAGSPPGVRASLLATGVTTRPYPDPVRASLLATFRQPARVPHRSSYSESRASSLLQVESPAVAAGPGDAPGVRASLLATGAERQPSSGSTSRPRSLLHASVQP